MGVKGGKAGGWIERRKTEAQRAKEGEKDTATETSRQGGGRA